jgi:predicted small lipoprotein YifL
MKTFIVLLILVATLASCNTKRTADLTPADMRKAVQRVRIQQKTDSIEFANTMWVLENNYQIAKRNYESSLTK